MNKTISSILYLLISSNISLNLLFVQCIFIVIAYHRQSYHYNCMTYECKLNNLVNRMIILSGTGQYLKKHKWSF